jgi:hypothetical protein
MAALTSLPSHGADYSKRLQALDPSIRTKSIGKCANATAKVVIELTFFDLVSGQLKGKEWPSLGQAAGGEHKQVGWASSAPSYSWDHISAFQKTWARLP